LILEVKDLERTFSHIEEKWGRKEKPSFRAKFAVWSEEER